MLENTKESIKIGQSRETGNIEYTRRRKTKQKTQHNMYNADFAKILFLLLRFCMIAYAKL